MRSGINPQSSIAREKYDFKMIVQIIKLDKAIENRQTMLGSQQEDTYVIPLNTKSDHGCKKSMALFGAVGFPLIINRLSLSRT